MQDELAEMIYYFGYAKVGNLNPTGFYEFDSHTPENLSRYNKFRIDSQASLDKVCKEGYEANSIY